MPKKNSLIGLALFLIVFIVYGSCISSSISFWDSPEFITSNYTLQASHPPGAPFYTLFCSTILIFFSASSAAFITNLISAFFGALTVLLLYKITYKVTEQILPDTLNKFKIIIPTLCGLLSSLTLAFSTSFWTAATEAEVYTMSFAIFCALIYVSILWETEKTRKKRIKWTLLFSFLLGISLSVHPILATIVIPLSILVAFNKFKNNHNTFVIAIFLGILFFVFIYVVVYRGLIYTAASLDIYTVNNFGFKKNFGAFLFFFTVILFFIIGAIYSAWKHYFKLKILALSTLLFILGLSFNILPILRSESNTLVAEKVNTANRLRDYISANRFGVDNIPLIYGPNYNAQLDNARPFISGKPKYTYDSLKKKYIEIDNGYFSQVNYSYKFKTLFPRMFDAKNEGNYKSWVPIKGHTVRHKVKGEIKEFQVPTLTENLNFFYNYQLVWLNLRYLLWNFIGRQNDYHGLGYIKNGNWISGIGFIDSMRLGKMELAPDHYQENKSKDSYYFLPFILGLIGLLALKNNRKYLIVSVLLFLTFGIGITLYINPLPSSILVRERDYIFIGSFILFSFWIGISLVFVSSKLQQFRPHKSIIWFAMSLLFIASPIQLLAKGWDNHQNSHDNFAYEFGKAYLDSCPEQAILITNGDNMTFPLWYLQDVEGYRTDVRVINFDQLNIDTHISNLKLKKHQSQPITIDLNTELYINGVEKLIPLKPETDNPINLEVLTDFLNAPNTLTNWNGKMRHYIPGSIFQIQLDTILKANEYESLSYNLETISEINWQVSKPFYGLNDIALLNLIKNNINKRPICFANNGKSNHLFGLEPFLVQEGLVSQLKPIRRKDKGSNPKIVNTKKSYELLSNHSSFTGMGNLDYYVKDESRTYAREILRQNFYFTAQALLEEDKPKKAREILNKCIILFPNEAVPFKEFAFSLGKLYIRLGDIEKGFEVCLKSMDNLKKELEWMLSTDPPNPIINVRHATKIYNMYAQMAQQLNDLGAHPTQTKINELKDLNLKLKVWQTTNWPYPNP